LKQNLSIEFHR